MERCCNSSRRCSRRARLVIYPVLKRRARCHDCRPGAWHGRTRDRRRRSQGSRPMFRRDSAGARDALIIPPLPWLRPYMLRRIADDLLALKLPAIGPERDFVRTGGSCRSVQMVVVARRRAHRQTATGRQSCHDTRRVPDRVRCRDEPQDRRRDRCDHSACRAAACRPRDSRMNAVTGNQRKAYFTPAQNRRPCGSAYVGS